MHEEPVRPGLEALRIAESGQVAPNRQERLLWRILGERVVAPDPVRDGVEAGADANGEVRECLFVATLCPEHERGIHVPLSAGRRDLPASTGYEWHPRTGYSIFIEDVPGDSWQQPEPCQRCPSRGFQPSRP